LQYKFPRAEAYLAEMQQEIEKQRELETANRLAKLNSDSKHDAVTIEVEPSEQPDKSEVKVEGLNEDVTLENEESDENSDLNVENTNAKKRIKLNNSDFKNEVEKDLEEEIELGPFNVEEFIDTPDVPLRTCEKKKVPIYF
jgi:hypothetical protein